MKKSVILPENADKMLHVSSSRASITDSAGKVSQASLSKFTSTQDNKAKVKLQRIAAPTDGGYGKSRNIVSSCNFN